MRRNSLHESTPPWASDGWAGSVATSNDWHLATYVSLKNVAGPMHRLPATGVVNRKLDERKERTMDTSTMTFEEILFNGRYHIIGAVILLVFVGAFLREAIREVLTERARRQGPVRTVAFGPLYSDAMLGHTMTDGGEPVDETGKSDRDE